MGSRAVVHRLGLRAIALMGAWALGAALGCVDSGTEAGDCVDGSLGCACIEGTSCDPGLACEAGVCVSPGTETGTSGTSGDGDATTTTTTTTTGDGDGDEPTDCHPLMVDCPTIGTTCIWDSGEFQCLPGMIQIGDSCVPDEPGGLKCISGLCAPMAMVPGCPSTHCCTAYCNLDNPNCPIDGTTCVDYFPDGATTPEVGACLAN